MYTENLPLPAIIIFAVTVFLWIRRPFGLPYSISTLIFFAALMAIGTPAATVFSGYATASFWTLVPALFFGFALMKTGLGKRIAFFCIKTVRPTLPRLIVMWSLIGVILSLLTPSIVVRVVIVTPIAAHCAELCGYERRSKERSILLISAWFMAVVPGTGWISGSLSGPILDGLFRSAGLGDISFADWTKASLLPILLTCLITVVVGYLLARPSAKATGAGRAFVEEYAKLGRVSKREIVTAVVLVACFLLFATGSLHGIPDAVLCLSGLLVLTLSRVIEVEEISTGINWDIAIFIGGAMGFGSVFEATGLSAWLTGLIMPVLSPLGQSPWLLFPVMLVVAIAIHTARQTSQLQRIPRENALPKASPVLPAAILITTPPSRSSPA
jgi:anion transporter